MWLLKLHFSISILCLLIFLGFKKLCNDTITENGYVYENNDNKSPAYWIFFIPVLNIIAVGVVFVMITTKREDFEKWCNIHKK